MLKLYCSMISLGNSEHSPTGNKRKGCHEQFCLFAFQLYHRVMEAKDRKALLGCLVHVSASEELIIIVYFLVLMVLLQLPFGMSSILSHIFV